jgi:hypothetical protein
MQYMPIHMPWAELAVHFQCWKVYCFDEVFLPAMHLALVSANQSPGSAPWHRVGLHAAAADIGTVAL